MTWVISCVNPTFGKVGFQYLNQAFTTEFFLFLAEKWHINRLEILEKKIAIARQRTILLVYDPYDHKYSGAVYVGLASIEF